LKPQFHGVRLDAGWQGRYNEALADRKIIHT